MIFWGKMQWSIIKVLVICVKCNTVLSLIQPHQYLSWIMKKKSIFTHLYLQVLEEELKQKKMKVIRLAFTTSCLVSTCIQYSVFSIFVCAINFKQILVDWEVTILSLRKRI